MTLASSERFSCICANFYIRLHQHESLLLKNRGKCHLGGSIKSWKSYVLSEIIMPSNDPGSDATPLDDY